MWTKTCESGYPIGKIKEPQTERRASSRQRRSQSIGPDLLPITRQVLTTLTVWCKMKIKSGLKLNSFFFSKFTSLDWLKVSASLDSRPSLFIWHPKIVATKSEFSRKKMVNEKFRSRSKSAEIRSCYTKINRINSSSYLELKRINLFLFPFFHKGE